MFGYNRRRCPKVAFCSLLRPLLGTRFPTKISIVMFQESVFSL